jgi:hypothetical protein
MPRCGAADVATGGWLAERFSVPAARAIRHATFIR